MEKKRPDEGSGNRFSGGRRAGVTLNYAQPVARIRQEMGPKCLPGGISRGAGPKRIPGKPRLCALDSLKPSWLMGNGADERKEK